MLMDNAALTAPDFCVRLCDGADSLAWDTFLESTPGANFYHRFAWRELNQVNFNHQCLYLAAVAKDGQFIGVLPLVYLRSKLFGRIVCSMPFVNFGGPCTAYPEVRAALLERTHQLVRELDADYAELRTLEPCSSDLPCSLHKVSMTLKLDNDPDRVWQAYSSKHRTNIRRAYKNEIQVQQGDEALLDDFYHLLAQNWRQHGTPIYRKSYFASILKAFPDKTRIFVAYVQGEPIATAFNGYYKDTVEGMWAGTSPKHQKLQPNYVLYWEMIKHACENGYQLYHLGRSTADSNAEQFKKKWNAISHQLYWQYILNKRSEVPQLNVNNPKFKLAIKAWRRLPLALTTQIGPFIAKSIP